MSPPSTVARGAVLMVAMRWTDQLVGIASTLILARLLVPDDFGVVAMAALVTGLVDVVFDFGLNTALIQNTQARSSHYDTAWTIRLVEGALAAAAVAAVAPFVAGWFQDARLTTVLQVLALGFIVSAAENIGVVTFQKELRFAADFRFAFSKRITGFVVTVLLAWWLRSYWALIAGGLAGRLAGLALSYRMHPMRPRLSWAEARSLFGVSQWMVMRSVLIYLNANVDRMLLGRRAAADVLGGYALSAQVAAMPSTELLAPLNRVLFPALVRAREDPRELRRVFLLAQGVQVFLAVPLSVGLVVLADELVLLLLGPAWRFVVPVMQVLALANIAQAINASGIYLLMTVGQFARQALATFVQLAGFLALALALGPAAGAVDVAWMRVAAALLGLVCVQVLMMRVTAIRWSDLLRTVHRPLVAAGVAAAVVFAVQARCSGGPMVMLLLKSMAGLSCYLGVAFGLWRLSGRPAGAESYLLAKVTGRVARPSRTIAPVPDADQPAGTKAM
jgi:O-antigen/teichoic acid export membrane protein